MRVALLAPSNNAYAGKIISKLVSSRHDFLVIQTPVRQGSNIFESIKNIIRGSGFDYFISMAILTLYSAITETWHDIIRKPIEDRNFISVKKVVKLHKLKSSTVRNINNARSLDILRRFKPDLMLTLYFNQILKQEVLYLPTKGVVNYHPALLPKYRGAEPYFWVLAKGEKETGISLHYADEGIDSGPVIIQNTIPIYTDSVHRLNLMGIEIGSQMIIRALTDIEVGKDTSYEQEESKKSVYSFVTREGMKEFRMREKYFLFKHF